MLHIDSGTVYRPTFRSWQKSFGYEFGPVVGILENHAMGATESDPVEHESQCTQNPRFESGSREKIAPPRNHRVAVGHSGQAGCNGTVNDRFDRITQRDVRLFPPHDLEKPP